MNSVRFSLDLCTVSLLSEVIWVVPYPTIINFIPQIFSRTLNSFRINYYDSCDFKLQSQFQFNVGSSDTVGINMNLRASVLCSIPVGTVKDLNIGEELILIEKKTGKIRRISLNGDCVNAIQSRHIFCEPPRLV
jgi:hypothetical protein